MRSQPLNRRTLVLGSTGVTATRLLAARGVKAQDGTPGATPVAPATSTVQIAFALTTYVPSTEHFANPERGFTLSPLSNSRSPSLLNAEELAEARRNGTSLARQIYSLSLFRASDISPSFLEHIQANFDIARTAGVKLIPRFCYNFNEPDGSTDDAAKTTILSHIDQLAPLLQRNVDVINHLEAGFIGQWGEWHDSSNGLDNVPDKRAILAKILSALPPTRMVAVRYPEQKRAIYGTNAPLRKEEAFTGIDRARTGHHNDCFLASDDDFGTYWPLDPPTLDFQKNYLSQDNRYVVQGGETCNNNPPRTDCPLALEELRRLRWSSLNSDFEENVLNGWRTQGCMSEIEQRLGYRFRLAQSTIPDRVAAGGTLSLRFDVTNDGWASPHNPRKVVVILRHRPTGTLQAVPVDADPRSWLAGETQTIELNAALPADLAAGDHDVLLHLPDPEPTLATRPEYAIRLANQGLWEPATGYNAFAKVVQV